MRAVVALGGNALLRRGEPLTAENLEGGLEDWSAAGFPLTTPQGAPGRVA